MAEMTMDATSMVSNRLALTPTVQFDGTETKSTTVTTNVLRALWERRYMAKKQHLAAKKAQIDQTILIMLTTARMDCSSCVCGSIGPGYVQSAILSSDERV
jgi:hypothetical protein